MSETIWKFPLIVTERQIVFMPRNARILSVENQHENLIIYAIVDPAETQVDERRILILGTGHPIPADEEYPGLDYIGTVQQHGGVLVWHVFEQNELPF